MSSILKVDTIQDQAGNNIISEAANVITIGASGDTITVPAGATVSGFTSAGIDDNATSVAITIDSSERVGIGSTSPSTKLTINEGGEPPAEGMLLLQANSSQRQLRISPPSNSANGKIDYRGGNLTFQDDGTEVARFQGTTGFGIGTSAPSRKLQVVQDSTSAGGIYLYSNAVHTGTDTNALLAVRSDSNNGSNNGDVVNIQGDGVGDLLVLNNNGTDRVTVQADGKVGIGTSSPATNLEIRTTASDNGILLKSTGNTGSALDFDANRTGALNGIGTLRAKWNGNGVSAIYLNAGSDTTNKDDGMITFNTRSSGTGVNPPERMRIDSSGNLLVGTTSAFSSSGITLGSNVVYSASSSQNAANFQRYGSEGEIIRLGKAGTTVGSLETAAVSTSGRLVVKSTTFDGYLNRAGTTIAKWMQSSFTPGADNTFDLGRSASERWKDIYLSGGAFLGGTGTANKLDDYEEGTFTPTFAAGITNVGYNNRVGNYIKVGGIVYFDLNIQTNAGTGSSARLKIGGLPFQPPASIAGGAVIAYVDDSFVNSATVNLPTMFFEPAGGGQIEFYNTSGGQYLGTDLHDPDGINVYIGGTYRTG